MGRKKKVDTEAAPPETAHGTSAVKTKMDAFRAAVAQGIESPKAISEYVKTTYGMEMSAGMVSAYKSMEKNKGKNKKPKAARAPMAPAAAKSNGGGAGNGLMLQLESIKVLVKDLGAEQVKRMVDLFA